MTPLALALMLGAADVSQPVSITVGELERMTPVQLAVRLLPPQDARRVVDGIVHRAATPWQSFGVRFWERPEPVGPMLCKRRTHSALFIERGYAGRRDADAVMDAQPISSQDSFGTTFPERATSERCARVTGYATGPSDARAATIAAINALTEAMAAASGRGPLPFALRCRIDEGATGCEDARSSLAALPLNAMFGVQFDTGNYRVLSETSAGPSRTVVRQMVRAPDGSPGTPTILFGNSGRDGLSWRITLVAAGNRVTEVQMQRTMVIYH